MIISLVSYPLDHRGKLENLAVYVYFIIKIQKIPLLANEMYKLQTHFGFTNLCSKVASFCPVSSQKVKNGTRTPCTLWFCTQSALGNKQDYIPRWANIRLKFHDQMNGVIKVVFFVQIQTKKDEAKPK